MISFPAPALTQVADEDLMIQIGSHIFPDCIARHHGENGIRLWVAGDPTNPDTAANAIARFQTILGVLRAWRAGAGELVEERRAGLGLGSVRDESGKHYVFLGPATAYRMGEGEVEQLARQAANGITMSENLQNALWLNGRMNRTGADYYMIHEYAGFQFGGVKGVTRVLGLSGKSQGRLTQSANNLSPLHGGRHASASQNSPLSLQEQGEYIADLLRRWIGQFDLHVTPGECSTP